MRHALVVGVGLLAVGLTACSKKDEAAKTGEAAPVAATAPGPLTMPHRKAGLWTQTISTSGVKQSMQIFFDGDTDAKMTVWGQAMGENKCSKNAIVPVPGGWKIDSVCELGEAGTVASASTVTGDFNSAYSVKVSSTTTGAAMAQANGTHEVAIDAKWEGPCPAGMKGGDIKVAGMPAGMTLNLEQMSATAGKQ